MRSISRHMSAGTVLLFSTVLALIVANSPFKNFYFELFEDTYLRIDFHFWKLEKPLYYWINDGLMAVFFLLIGLEIKRELIIGALSSVQKALVPLVAAAGGMLVPALIFAGVNLSNPKFIDGWAIPMATDIAFALGVLTILGKKVPLELKVFLTSLAIVDDLGAVLTIAVYYTDTIVLAYLGVALGSWIFMLIMNRMGVRSMWAFVMVGTLLVWYPLLKSGVHATIAGVLVAFTIPLQRKFDSHQFLKNAKQSIENFRNKESVDHTRILNASQYSAIEELEDHCAKVTSPLQKLEHQLHNITLFGIMPLFAFANTGIDFSKVDFGELLTSGLSIGIFCGLVIGKVTGIVGFVYLFAKLGLIKLSKTLNLRHYLGAGFLAGIGFTMSIFITDLAFHKSNLGDSAKMAILIASLISGGIGYFILSQKGKPKTV